MQILESAIQVLNQCHRLINALGELPKQARDTTTFHLAQHSIAGKHLAKQALRARENLLELANSGMVGMAEVALEHLPPSVRQSAWSELKGQSTRPPCVFSLPNGAYLMRVYCWAQADALQRLFAVDADVSAINGWAARRGLRWVLFCANGVRIEGLASFAAEVEQERSTLGASSFQEEDGLKMLEPGADPAEDAIGSVN